SDENPGEPWRAFHGFAKQDPIGVLGKIADHARDRSGQINNVGRQRAWSRGHALKNIRSTRCVGNNDDLLGRAESFPIQVVSDSLRIWTNDSRGFAHFLVEPANELRFVTIGGEKICYVVNYRTSPFNRDIRVVRRRQDQRSLRWT